MRIACVLRDDEAECFRLVALNILRDLQQGVAQDDVKTDPGANDGGDGQHGGCLSLGLALHNALQFANRYSRPQG